VMVTLQLRTWARRGSTTASVRKMNDGMAPPAPLSTN
jgi:hypothetical protein